MTVDVARPTLEDEVAAILAGERLEDPFPIWDRLREEAGVLRVGNAVFFSRFDDVKSVVSDSALFSNACGVTGEQLDEVAAPLSPDADRMLRELDALDLTRLTRSDGANHDRLRKISHRFFTPRRMQELAVEIQRFTDELLDRAADEDVYDLRFFARELALRVMTHVIGSPDVDREYIAELSARVAPSPAALSIAAWGGTAQDERVRDAYAAMMEFREYIESVVLAEHRRKPGSNELVAALMEAEGADNLTTSELSTMLHNLLNGGFETSAVLLSSGPLELLRNRTQWELLCDDPGRATAAVEELLRFVSPAQWVIRSAAVDVDWNGFEIAAGETVLPGIAAANRDPAAFEEPRTLDITRTHAPHLGLGFGSHFCLGASLIRNEARIAFATLSQRHPGLELAAPESELRWAGGNPVMRSLSTLPVSLGPRRDA
jgi:cytochrome P450